ncbi:hypothetical protein EPA93_03955 [Ktedonosporobacter rubrisoli]|uniref:Uncharacterized protein n=1 Tax=Ktedonosporobacter rubrisoli TaxID=2509675 RepID=A0A4V0YY70_KTERU|nr:hypothetical protein [Ktedonosporobacter rubrisoli]QBD75191.1 hypothetical protein EPA93_03955 [Ktedonosporobacter rubrisoli]
MFDPFSLLPRKKKPYKAFAARKGEPPHGKSNGSDDEAEWIRTAPTGSFEILDSLKSHIAPKYMHFVFPVYNRLGKNAALVFHNLVVKIYGEHLQELILSIRRETCIYIQVFNEKEHLPPKKGEAIIKRIEIDMGDALKAYCMDMEAVIKEYFAEMGTWTQPETLPEPLS